MSRRLRSLANTFDESGESDASDPEEEIDLKSESNDEGSDTDENNSDAFKDEEKYIIHSDAESGSDEAPDDIGFNITKNEALKNIQQAIDVLKNDKASKKNKRKQKEELFQMQKSKKLAEMEKNRLPEDILEAVSGKNLNTPKQDIEEEKTQNSRIRFEKEELFCNEPGLESEEFIPLNSSKGLVVKSVQSNKKKPSHTAKDFRDNVLYGNRIKRVDAQTLERQKAKRRARYV